MKLIDADALERDGWQMSRTVRINKDTMELQTRKPTDFDAADDINMYVNLDIQKIATHKSDFSDLDDLPSAQPEITFEDIKKYCEKRRLVILTREFYDEMKSRLQSAPNDFEEPDSACSDCQEFDCYGCEHKEESK